MNLLYKWYLWVCGEGTHHQKPSWLIRGDEFREGNRCLQHLTAWFSKCKMETSALPKVSVGSKVFLGPCSFPIFTTILKLLLVTSRPRSDQCLRGRSCVLGTPSSRDMWELRSNRCLCSQATQPTYPNSNQVSVKVSLLLGFEGWYMIVFLLTSPFAEQPFESRW